MATSATILTSEEYPSGPGTSTEDVAFNFDNYEYSQAYEECLNELDQALKCTKSKKLHELISPCLDRLRLLKEFANHQDTLIKQLQEFQINHFPANANQFILSTSTNGGLQGQGHTTVQLQPTFFTTTNLVRGDHPEHALFQTQYVEAVYTDMNPQQESNSIPSESESVLKTHSVKTSTPAKRRKTSIANQTGEGITTVSNTSLNTSSRKVLQNQNKESMVDNALKRAALHDFGELARRYERSAIMAMVEGGVRESVKTFVEHGMLERFSDPNRPRAYACKECGGKVLNNHISAMYHCLRDHLNSFKPFQCDQCDKAFFASNDLRCHISKHTNVYRHHCPREGCSYKTNEKYMLDKHMKGHQEVSPSVFQVKAKFVDLNEADSTGGSDSAPKPQQVLVEKSLAIVKDTNGTGVANDRDVSAREAVERAKNHDFGDLQLRFSQEGILAMVDNGAREIPKAFIQYGMIRQSALSKRGRPTYECNMPECNRMMLNESNNAIYHCLRVHLKFFPYKCSSCDKAFYTRSNLRSHFSKHSGIWKYTCAEKGCSYKTNVWKVIERHVLSKHRGIRRHQCNFEGCDKAFASDMALKAHMQRHSGAAFPCDWPGCNKQCSSKLLLARHKRGHKAIEEARFMCQKCDYRATDGFALNLHAKLKHGTDEEKKRYSRVSLPRQKCPECGVHFASFRLKEHMKSAHSDNSTRSSKPTRSVTCSHCQKLFSTNNYKIHLKHEHPEFSPNLGHETSKQHQRSTVECPLCSVRILKISFKSHFQRKHLESNKKGRPKTGPGKFSGHHVPSLPHEASHELMEDQAGHESMNNAEETQPAELILEPEGNIQVESFIMPDEEGESSPHFVATSSNDDHHYGQSPHQTLIVDVQHPAAVQLKDLISTEGATSRLTLAHSDARPHRPHDPLLGQGGTADDDDDN